MTVLATHDPLTHSPATVVVLPVPVGGEILDARILRFLGLYPTVAQHFRTKAMRGEYRLGDIDTVFVAKEVAGLGAGSNKTLDSILLFCAHHSATHPIAQSTLTTACQALHKTLYHFMRYDNLRQVAFYLGKADFALFAIIASKLIVPRLRICVHFDKQVMFDLGVSC